jgi:hypothetical protein
MNRQLATLLFTIITLLTPQVSQANSDSVSVAVNITLVTSVITEAEYDEDNNLVTTSWDTSGNDDDYVGMAVIVVRVGTDWNYDEYTYSLNEPNYTYHATTFLPDNFLNDKDPFGEAVYASLTYTNHYTDFFHFADPDTALAAADETGGLETDSVIKNGLIKTIY